MTFFRPRVARIRVFKKVSAEINGNCPLCGEPRYYSKVGAGKRAYPGTRLTCRNACELQDYKPRRM